jgi:tetratricopeptide (TPR) repeat protein
MEMDKILKPYTIIPPELYIQRDADRQVDNIIRDMGRPGYALVSRQMGKTNLLLNAKRRLENANDIFAYIDLSNPFDELRGCFENIIDTILDTNEEKLSTVSEIIKENRNQQKDIPPFKQHTNELRLILKHISGKLVIILDEIDALTKMQYSDQIFAQIRSIYFSRSNFKELERLTYILSGVVEPNEIIKDPKISPFNIGEKIFLNDFSKDEFEQFVVKSKLILSETIKDRIFFWTDGNPRITWDVCSEIEDRFSNKDLSQKDIDDLITEMYLTTYDRPPVDNIRELVINDRELRNAIIEISYQKGKEISDKIKSKLYLAGITNYNGSNDVHIKNEIIKQSLSVDWIRKVEEEDKGLIKLALEYYEKKNYQDSLSYFEKYRLDNEFEKEAGVLYHYYMGHSAYCISKFDKALKYLNLAKFDKDDSKTLYYTVLNLKGLTYYYLGKPQDSLSCFKEVIDSDRKDEIYIRALFNFGSIALKSEEEKYKEESLKIFEDVTNEIAFDKEKLEQSFIEEIKSIAHYNIAQIQSSQKEITNAIDNFNKALKLSKIETKPIILLGLYESIILQEEKQKIIKQLIDVIVENNIIPISDEPDKPMSFNLGHLRNVLIISFLNEEVEFEKLKPWLSYLGEKNFAEHIQDLGFYTINYENDWESGIKLFERIYENLNNDEYDVSNLTKYQTLQILAFVERQNSKKKSEYISFFTIERLKPIDHIDFDIFANLISIFINRKDFSRALQYTDIIQSVKPEVDKHLLVNYIVICNFELLAYHYLNKYDKAKLKASEILELCNNETLKKQKSNLLGDTGLETIRKNAESVLSPKIRDTKPIVVGKTYGRNETVKVKYKDGRIIQVKYKKVQNDIENKECFIMNE